MSDTNWHDEKWREEALEQDRALAEFDQAVDTIERANDKYEAERRRYALLAAAAVIYSTRNAGGSDYDYASTVRDAEALLAEIERREQ